MVVTINVYPQIQNVEITTEPNLTTINIVNQSGGGGTIDNITEIPNRSYNDLQDLPTIPTATDELTNNGEDGVNPFITDVQGYLYFNNNIFECDDDWHKKIIYVDSTTSSEIIIGGFVISPYRSDLTFTIITLNSANSLVRTELPTSLNGVVGLEYFLKPNSAYILSTFAPNEFIIREIDNAEKDVEIIDNVPAFIEDTSGITVIKELPIGYLQDYKAITFWVDALRSLAVVTGSLTIQIVQTDGFSPLFSLSATMNNRFVKIGRAIMFVDQINKTLMLRDGLTIDFGVDAGGSLPSFNPTKEYKLRIQGTAPSGSRLTVYGAYLKLYR